MSRKHHKTKFKSQKAKTKVGSSYNYHEEKITEQPKKETKTYHPSTVAYKTKICHKITEIYDGFYLMGRADEVKFVKDYKPDVIVPLAGTLMDLYKEGFRGDFYYYPVPDFGTIPEEILDKLVLKIVAGLTCGLKIGMYCQGGHGRTGYVAACVLGVLGIEDPIDYLWTHYCKQAIESKEQLRAISNYLKKPELYTAYQSSFFNSFSKDWGAYYGSWGTTSGTTSGTAYSQKKYGAGDYSSSWKSFFPDDDDADEYYAYLLQKAAEVKELDLKDDESDYEEAIDEDRVLSPTEIKLLQNDPMWSCSTYTLENLQGEQLQEAFDYLRDVYGVG